MKHQEEVLHETVVEVQLVNAIRDAIAATFRYYPGFVEVRTGFYPYQGMVRLIALYHPGDSETVASPSDWRRVCVKAIVDGLRYAMQSGAITVNG